MPRKPLITANMVTAARLAAMPILTWMVFHEPYWWYALVLGTVIGSTDFVDGYLARKQGPTVLGGLLDPIADKVLIASWYLPLAAPSVALLSPWPVAFLLMREFLITAMRSAFEQRDMVMKTSYLGKVKTWVQMQGLGVAVLLMLLRDERQIMTGILAAGVILPIVATFGVYLVQKRLYVSALVMSGLQAVALGLYLAVEVELMVLIVLLFIVALTWISGANYFIEGWPKLRAKGDFRAADGVRIAAALALPLSAVLAMTEAAVPFVTVLGVLAIELAVGGLDNLLSHHRVSSGALAWAARTLGASALLAATPLVTMLGMPTLASPLAIAALTISVIGGFVEFWRGRDYYLDARLRDKKAVASAA